MLNRSQNNALVTVAFGSLLKTKKSSCRKQGKPLRNVRLESSDRLTQRQEVP